MAPVNKANKRGFSEKKAPSLKKIKREKSFLTSVPQDRDPYVSTEGYLRHIKMNEMRVQQQLDSSERVVDCDEDLEHETGLKKVEYDQLISHEVHRYLLKNHLEKAFKQLEDEEMNNDEGKTESTCSSIETSDMRSKWEALFNNAFFVGQKLEAYDKLTGHWYEAKIVELETDSVSCQKLPASTSSIRMKLHWFNFQSKHDFWISMSDFQNRSPDYLRDMKCIAPPYVFTAGTRYPSESKQKKNRPSNVELVLVDEVDAQRWFKGGDVDCDNIISGRRRHTRVETSQQDDIEKYSKQICPICGEQYYHRDLTSTHQLYLCEGQCHRVFHAPCLEVPTPDPKDPFFCKECMVSKHDCATCYERDGMSLDDKGSTHRCAFKGCGKFFHMSCVKEDERTHVINESQFNCAAHCCVECLAKGHLEGARSGRVKTCTGCLNGFHDRCMPHGAISNDCAFLCNICAQSFELCLSIVAPTAFQDKLAGRKSGDFEIDFTRYFQQQAFNLNVDNNVSMRIPREILSIKDKVKTKISKMPKYAPLKRNMYTGGAKPLFNSDATETCCRCVTNCDENCDNRLLRIECINSASRKQEPNPKLMRNCNSKYCGNTCFQNMNYKRVEAVATPGRGWGLLPKTRIADGDFIIEYVGEVISPSVSRQRMEEVMQSSGERHVFQMDMGNDQIIDARYKGNLARFINHSCDPNCMLNKWSVNGITSIGIFAKRDISKGEELTFDYSFESSDGMDFVCLCGSPNCRGTLDAVTNKYSEAKRHFEQIKKKIANFERKVREKRGGLLSKQFLRRLVKSEGEDNISKWMERKTRENKRVAVKAQRQLNSKSVLQSLVKNTLTRDTFNNYFPHTNKPFLLRNISTGMNFLERMDLKRAKN